VVERALAAGFHRVGVAAVDQVRRYGAYRAWVDAGFHGEMAYMGADDHIAARREVERIAAGARSVIAVAVAYGWRDPDPEAVAGVPIRGRVARYARGRDYHQVLKAMLYGLAEELGDAIDRPVIGRPCVDSAPLLERGFAEAAGIGFVGKNTMLISPGLGSYTVLGELLTDVEIAPTAKARSAGGLGGARSAGGLGGVRRLGGASSCGDCRACLDAGPTGAIAAPWVLDARRCVSYLTIEHRGPIPRSLRPLIGDMIFGCDICQEVCPYNAAAPARTPPATDLADDSIDAARPDLAALAAMGSNQRKRWNAGRATRRASRGQLLRNVAIALGNSTTPAAREPLEHLAADRDPIVAEAARWALAQLGLMVTAL
jgi:epoxyqueuosine reductase